MMQQNDISFHENWPLQIRTHLYCMWLQGGSQRHDAAERHPLPILLQQAILPRCFDAQTMHEVPHFLSCREAVKAMMQQNDILFHWNRPLQIGVHLYFLSCREAVKAMMQQNDIPFHESRLQAVGLAEVYTRLCGNLINIYSHSRNTSKQGILLDMLLAISPNNIEYSIRHAQVVISPNNIEYSIRHAQVVINAAWHAAWCQH